MIRTKPKSGALLSTDQMICLEALRVIRSEYGTGLPSGVIAEAANMNTIAVSRAMRACMSAGLVRCNMQLFKGRKRLCWHLTPAGLFAADNIQKPGDTNV